MTHATYAHVILDLDPDEKVDAAEIIVRARSQRPRRPHAANSVSRSNRDYPLLQG
jgi:hypothetical protein